MPTALNGVVDLNQNMGAADFAAPINTRIFFGKHPIAAGHRQFHAEVGARIIAQSKGYRALDAEILEQVQHCTLQRDISLNDTTRYFDWVKDPVTGKDVQKFKPHASEAWQKKIDDFQRQREDNRKLDEKLPPNRVPMIDAGATRAGKTDYIEVEMIGNGKTFSENADDFNAAMKERRAIIGADLTPDEIAANLTAHFADIKERGQLSLASHAAGGRFNQQTGEYQIGVPAPFNLPQLQAFVGGEHPATVLYDDSFAAIIALDDNDIFLKSAIAKTVAFSAGKRQIAIADRPALLLAQDKKILAARRGLEFNCRQMEAEGRFVQRPKDTSWEILLWVERVERTATLPKPKAAKPVVAADFEGDDADDE